MLVHVASSCSESSLCVLHYHDQFHQQPLVPCKPHGTYALQRPQQVAATQVAILDGNNQKVPTGKIGEVCVKGPNVTAGYLNNPSANKEAFAGAHPAC